MVRGGRAFALATSLALGLAAGAEAQYGIPAPDGKSSIKLGLLGQVQAERLEGLAGASASQNIFVRRARLLFGGKLGDKVSVFMETDSPNVGKAAADGKKNEGSLYLQDLIVTYGIDPHVKVDAGLLLLPLTYHSGQSAATLMGVDYGPYAFLASSPTNCRGGRDYGAMARGYFFGQHLEVRAGVFQGVRGVDAAKPFRGSGRVVWYLLEPQTDFFYTGTTRGGRRLLGIGASYDRQQNYSSFGADAFLDHRVSGSNSITAQADYSRLDGGTSLPDVPRQTVWFGEVGYYLARPRLQPFLQLNRRDYAAATRADESFYQVGLSYWLQGDKMNLKIGVGRLETQARKRVQVLAQAQILLW